MAEQAESIDNPLHEAAKRGKCDLDFGCVMLMLKDSLFCAKISNISRMGIFSLFWFPGVLT